MYGHPQQFPALYLLGYYASGMENKGLWTTSVEVFYSFTHDVGLSGFVSDSESGHPVPGKKGVHVWLDLVFISVFF